MLGTWSVAGACAVALTVVGFAWGAAGTPRGDAKTAPASITIYSSLPEQGASHDQAKAIENGARLALSERGGKVGKHQVSYRRLDDSLASTGAADEGRGARNARKAGHDKSTIGYIGEYDSGISKVTIPILNRHGIAQISPSNTYTGLTSTAPGHDPGEPQKYYPTGRRTYARILPIDPIQAGALVAAAKQDGCGSVHVFYSGTTYSSGLARNIGRAAPKAGLTVRASVAYDPSAGNYKKLASKVKARCVIQTGEIEEHGVRLIKDVAAAHHGVRFYGSDGICLNASTDPTRGIPPSLAPRFKCAIAALAPKSFGPKGRQFFARFSGRYHQKHPDPYAIYGYEAMSLMLDSITRAVPSGGGLTRSGVVDALFETKNRDSVIGTYSIDKNGDTTLTDYGLYKIVGKLLRFDRVIRAQRPAARWRLGG